MIISEMKRKAQSASHQLSAPTFRERNAEVKQQQQKEKEKDSSAPTSSSSASSPLKTTTTATSASDAGFASLESSRAASPSATVSSSLSLQSQQQQQQQQSSSSTSSIPTLPLGPLLQTLGRPQTLTLREISSNCVPRCEKMQQETAKLNLELQGLKSAALQQIRLGQKCYSVETEVKRLHLELSGDEKGSAAARSIGYDEAFPSLMSVCEETSELLDKVHKLLEDEPRKLLQEYAQKIEAKSPRSPVMSPVKKRR